MLEDTLRALAATRSRRASSWPVDVSPEVPDDLVGDPDRLRRIVVNLVGNAIKFTENGEVVMQRERGIADSEQGMLLHFSVTDTGIGIPHEKQKHIFEAFAQADTSTTRKYGGTGLGLAISAQLCGVDGRARCGWKAKRGGAARFTSRRSSDCRNRRLRNKRGDEPVKLRDLPVLVVDDNSTNRKILEEMIANWRMKPVAAQNGAAAMEALSLAHKNGDPFRLVLLDGHMPEMDGFEVAASVKKDPQLRGAAIDPAHFAGPPRGSGAREKRGSGGRADETR